jgi:NAD(P)-dependent dehydrogenase (short-subunit alcohol dehydrogenase family)
MNNPFDLSNKNILVTGSSAGIGKQIAISASEMGANCWLTGRNLERLQNTKKALSVSGSHGLIQADLNSEEEIKNLVSGLSSLDGVVLNAGMLKTAPFKFIKKEQIEESMQVNFTSSMLLLNELVKQKKLNKNASIVFISSIGGNVIGHVGNVIYSATKGAINGVVKVLALEFANRGIRVNSIMPGMVKTELWDNGSYTEEQILEDEKKYPLGYGAPEDVANTVLFLLSNASKWMTGSHVLLDGGYSAQ